MFSSGRCESLYVPSTEATGTKAVWQYCSLVFLVMIMQVQFSQLSDFFYMNDRKKMWQVSVPKLWPVSFLAVMLFVPGHCNVLVI